MYYIYVLKSLKDGNLYIGQTLHVKKRLQYHNSGRAKSTKHRVPFKLIYTEEFKNRGEALKREKDLKSIANRDFKRALRGIRSNG